jgi:hypothetical protein
MPDIDIKRRHGLTRGGAKKKVESLARSLQREMHGGAWSWTGEAVLEGTATGLKKGRITVTAKLIRIELDLAFYVPSAPVKRKVLERLDIDFPEPG